MNGPSEIKQDMKDAGFSLLETLFALAIMSLASLALFQSTSAMLSLSDRAVKAGERTVNHALDRDLLGRLIDGVLPGWPGAQDTAFTGEAQQLSGLSAGAPRQGSASATQFQLSLEPQGRDMAALIYRAYDTGTFADAIEDTEGWVLRSGFPVNARFEYMGVDQAYHPKWPPAKAPSRGYFNDDDLQRPADLPEAVRLRSASGVTLWTAVISRSTTLPNRFDPAIGL